MTRLDIIATMLLAHLDEQDEADHEPDERDAVDVEQADHEPDERHP